MADRLAVGLAKSVVVGAITKVQSVIEEDAKLREKVKRDLVSITLEFEMMQSFLDDANEEMKSKVVRTWVKHIRQLAYDVEDCVENVVQLDDKPVFWRRLLPSCMVEPLQLDQAVEEIEQLKGRVEEVNNCYRRYNLINESVGSSKPAVVIHQPQPPVPGASDMLCKARDATQRRQGTFGDLTRLISKEDNKLQVISLWGSASDHGTTSIIRETFTHSEICQDFTYRAWVKLMHPFSPYGFIRSLMAQFYANSCKEENAATAGMHVLMKMEAAQAHLFNEFKQLILEKKYLIVLEGLSTMVDWDTIRTFLPDKKNGSCIILSTQEPEIASLCVGHFYDILEFKKFSDDHSVCVLFKEPPVDEARQSSPSGKKMKDAEQWMEDNLLVGRESQINELRRCLAGARFPNSQVVSVWGMAGIGKSHLIRYLYFNRMFHTKQFQKYSWVDVPHPFNLRGFSRSLLLDLFSEEDPIKQCRELLEQYQCLVVIDNLRSKEEWDLIQAALLSRRSSSVIIVITTEASIASYCTNIEANVNVRCLDDDAAFDLFRQEVLKMNPTSPLAHYRNMELDDLILKCGGIPTVIAAIAGLLAPLTVTGMDTVYSLHSRFMHHLENNPELDGLQDLLRWMHSIILNPPDFLKPCIFYLSIFPRGCYIRRRRLLRRWIAEGYSKESVDRNAEENAESFFSELVQLSIFKQLGTSASTRVGFYQVNSFIRAYIISRSTEENLVFELAAGRALNTPSRGRHLVILENWDRDRILYERMHFSRLWSLTVFGKWESFFISKTMKLLRVLDLEDAQGVTDNDLHMMVKLLRHLKFLSLRGCHEICHLPRSLGELRQLQTLDVRQTSIVTIPVSITELQKLQYIRAGLTIHVASAVPSNSWFCRRPHLVGVKVPSGIGKLTALHTLGVIDVAASGRVAIIKELRKLTQLRKLGASGINKYNGKGFITAISAHVHLESLSVHLDQDNKGCLDDISLPWENLQSLKLYGLGDKLPQPRSQFTRLRKLALEMDTLMQNDIDFLANLPELCILRLRVKQQLQGGRLHFYAEMSGEQLDTFEKVKILEIACCTSELHVTFGSKSMQNLELLTLDYTSASYQLAGLKNLFELKHVLLKGTNDEAFRAEFASHLASHPRQPVVKLEALPRSS